MMYTGKKPTILLIRRSSQFRHLGVYNPYGRIYFCPLPGVINDN